jgi:hypothetical protein
MLNPVSSFVSYSLNYLSGKVTVDTEPVEINYFPDKTFTSFRHIKINKPCSSSPAVFWVRFTLPDEITFKKNVKVSARALPFFAGLPGFREKYWCVHRKSNEYLGFYQWASKADAENYLKSFAVRFMTSRAVKNSVKFGIIESTILDKALSQD